MFRQLLVGTLAAGALTFAAPTVAAADCVFICPSGQRQPVSPFFDDSNWPKDKILPPRDLDLDHWAESKGVGGDRRWWRPEPVAVGTGLGGGGGGGWDSGTDHGCFIICW